MPGPEEGGDESGREAAQGLLRRGAAGQGGVRSSVGHAAVPVLAEQVELCLGGVENASLKPARWGWRMGFTPRRYKTMTSSRDRALSVTGVSL